MTISLYSWVKVGMIVAVDCVDWSHQSEQVEADYEHEIVPAEVYGRVVRVYEGGLSIAHQSFFSHKQSRQVTTIPWGCIRDVHPLIVGPAPKEII